MLEITHLFSLSARLVGTEFDAETPVQYLSRAMQGLTKRQEQTLDFIRQSIEDRGYPPTLREIGEHMGIRSTNGVNDHLRALERKGYLTREDMKSRALKLVEEQAAAQPAPARLNADDDLIEVRVLGRVAAGLPLYAEENVIDTVRVDRMLVRGGREVFGLRVTGDSMIDAGILSGDYIFVKKQATADRGDIVVALIGDEATVKYFYPEREYVRFQPANSQMAPILVRATDFKSTMLLGKVVGVYRRL
jgi:repressor LexA